MAANDPKVVPLTRINLKRHGRSPSATTLPSSWVSHSVELFTDPEVPVEERIEERKRSILACMFKLNNHGEPGIHVLRNQKLRYHRNHVCVKTDCAAEKDNLDFWEYMVKVYHAELLHVRYVKYGTPSPSPSPSMLREVVAFHEFVAQWPAMKEGIQQWVEGVPTEGTCLLRPPPPQKNLFFLLESWH